MDLRPVGKNKPPTPKSCERLFMRQLQLLAHGEPSDVIELNTGAEPALCQEDVLISMEAAPLNPSDFVLVRGMYGIRPCLVVFILTTRRRIKGHYLVSIGTMDTILC